MKLQALEARVAAQADSLHQTELAERLAQDQVQKLSAELNAARPHARTHARKPACLTVRLCAQTQLEQQSRNASQVGDQSDCG
jgi:4'-phosphopantetheinyl transferase EntD